MFSYKYLRPVILAALLIITVLLTGCPDKGEQKPIQPSVKVGVSLADMERDGNQIIKKEMDNRGKEDKINFLWKDAQNDPDKQQKQIDELLKEKVKVVILQLVDPAMGTEIVQKLTKEKIKVIALETLSADTPMDGFIASDHKRVGELQARYILQAVSKGEGEGMRVLVLQGDPSDLAAKDITAANEEVLKGNPQVAELRVTSHLQAEPRLARATVEEFLAGGQPDAVLANDSRLAMAAVEVLKANGLERQVVTVGVGADKKASQAIASGEHDAEVDNSPELLGQYLSDAVLSLAKTGHWDYNSQVQNGPYDVPSKITPVKLITKDELYLLTDRWGDMEKKADQEEKEPKQQQGSNKEQSSGEQGSGEQSNSEQSSGQQGNSAKGGSEQKPKTILKITTQDGKTMEVEIDGEVKTIESQQGGEKGQQGGQEGGQGEQGGQQQGQ